MISIDLQSEIKRIKNQSNPSIHKKTNISLSVEGKSQNPSQNTTLSQFNKISKDQFSRETSNQRSRIYRPQTCISHEETNVLESS